MNSRVTDLALYDIRGGPGTSTFSPAGVAPISAFAKRKCTNSPTRLCKVAVL